jgi:hypothetical protein
VSDFQLIVPDGFINALVFGHGDDGSVGMSGGTTFGGIWTR